MGQAPKLAEPWLTLLLLATLLLELGGAVPFLTRPAAALGQFGIDLDSWSALLGRFFGGLIGLLGLAAGWALLDRRRAPVRALAALFCGYHLLAATGVGAASLVGRAGGPGVLFAVTAHGTTGLGLLAVLAPGRGARAGGAGG